MYLATLDCATYEDLQDRRKPSIQQNPEQAVVVRDQNPALHLTPQDDQLMSERRVLSLKPTLLLERRDQDRQGETQKCKHYPLTVRDSSS